MARRNAVRSIEGETNLAWRISHEREERGWSYDALARRMTEAGCPINASAIYKIEKGDPPRKIGVDELIAFARVFGREVEDLLTPRDIYQKARMKEVVRAVEDARANFIDALHPLVDAHFEFFNLVAEDSEAAEAAMGHIFNAPREYAEGQVESDVSIFSVESNDGMVLDVDQTPLKEGIVELYLAIIKQAELVFEAVNPELKGTSK
ncbi:helix-turn-helix transcriptional regulator [Janibacter sp. FSL W8-0316]|uniref:helix-turn-helix domain-containing protein n=1 Tax=Janibacter sp. FSL W8-0316 TaxID=2975325 RepID=UPI0030F8C40C